MKPGLGTTDLYLYFLNKCFSVEKTTDSSIQVTTKIYKVVVFDSNDTVLFPKEIKKSVPFSFAYLAVNSKTRTTAIFYHNVGDKVYT